MSKLLLLLSLSVMLISCNKEEGKDIVEKIIVTVDSKTKEYTPWGSDKSYDGLNIKEEGNSNWTVIPIDGIEDFVYNEGYEYKLSTFKTTLANPPMDASNVEYKLISVLQQNKP